MNKSISEIVDTLYVSINNAYHGNKSDITLTLKQMSDNVDAYLKAGDWNMAMKEAQRCQKTDASSFWGWWCMLKVLTNGQGKVNCKPYGISYKFNQETIEAVQKNYNMAYQFADDEHKKTISQYYHTYAGNLYRLSSDISELDQRHEQFKSSNRILSDTLNVYIKKVESFDYAKKKLDWVYWVYFYMVYILGN